MNFNFVKRLGTLVMRPLTNLKEKIVVEMLKNILAKTLSSFLKSATAGLIVSLTAALTALPETDDKITAFVFALFIAVVNAVISGLKRAATFDPAKVIK